MQSAQGGAEFGPQLAKSSAREQQLDGLGAEGFGMTFPALKVFHKALLKCYSICPLLWSNLKGPLTRHRHEGQTKNGGF